MGSYRTVDFTYIFLMLLFILSTYLYSILLLYFIIDSNIKYCQNLQTIFNFTSLRGIIFEQSKINTGSQISNSNSIALLFTV